MSQPKSAYLMPDKQTCIFEGRTYRCAFHVSKLQEWLRFYRRLRDRDGGRYRKFFEPSVAALEVLEAQIKERVDA